MTAPVVIVGVNSWVTVAQADTYCAGKFGAAAWAGLGITEKTQLLISATRWLMRQPTLSVSLADTAQVLRDAQCEAAWFIYNYQDEYERRRALISSGVKSFSILGFSESYGDITFPAFLSEILYPYVTSTDISFPRMGRDMSENSSE
jgi:hypothetical protein